MVPPTILTDAEWQHIKAPTLYLVGENEKLYSAQKAVQRLHKAAAQIEAEVIPKAGHDLTFVQAELVNRKVVKFLERPYH
jgi:pimeloyl-ACP methyl ester carboxylesterase